MSGYSDSLEFPLTSASLTTLSNGLEVIVKEDSSAPVVSLQAWCRAGSIHEGDWLGAGMSHFLEHMLFKGTENRDGPEIAKTVQQEGGYINAYTSFDRTVYWIDSPSTGADTCLDVLCDVIGFSSLPEDEFESESDVIRREIAMGEDNPEQVLGKVLFRTAYSVHPCRHPVIGYLDVFNQLSRDDLYAYYREKYTPDNIFIVVVGDVKREKVVEQIREKLGGIPRRRRAPVVLPEEPAQLGIREEFVEFPTDLFRGRLAWPLPSATHGDVAALDLMVQILGDGRSSRLFRSIREQKQLAHSIGSYAYTPSFSGQLMVSFDTEPDKSEAAEVAIFEELHKLRGGGVSREELAKVKRQALSAQFSTLTDMRGQASDLASNWILTRNLDYTREYVHQVQAVDEDQIAEVANRYLNDSCYTRVSLLPKKETVAVASSSRASRSEDIRKVTLENGLTVLLLSDRRVPFVQANGVFRGGLLAETPETNGITRLMARMLTKDTRKRSAAELAERIESVGGGISGSFGNNSFGVGVNGLRPDLSLVVDTIGEALLEPAFLGETLEKERQFQLAQLKAEGDRPFTVALKQLRKDLYGDHPYGLESSGTESTVSSLQVEQVMGFHQRLVRGGNGVLGVFGDLDLSEAEDMIRERFDSGLLGGEREFSVRSEYALPDLSGNIADLKHEKEQAVLLIGFRTVDLLHPDNPALEMIDEACSDMASRLFIRIREELGLAYSVGATRMMGLEPGFLVFYVSTSPEKLDLVQAEMLDEIELMKSEGLAEDEFERAKASWLGRELIHLQGAKELAATATVDELVGLGWDNYRKTPDLVRELDRTTVQEAAQRYLVESNRAIVRLTT